MKRFYIQQNIGRAKYVVNHNDGEKQHADGSDFFDVSIFSNKKDLALFTKNLKIKGYKEL